MPMKEWASSAGLLTSEPQAAAYHPRFVLRSDRPTPLAASITLTVLASAGTAVIWNGLPFIGRREHGFDETTNLVLYLCIGIVYIVGAFSAGRVLPLLERVISPRRVLTIVLLTQTAACGTPLISGGVWTLWVAGCVASGCSAWLWPIVESYLVAGRHGKDMHRAIGWWNIAWMVSVAAAMFAMAPLMEAHATMAIVGLGVCNLLAACVLPAYATRPPRHDEVRASAEVPASYASLLRGGRVLLPLSYALNGILAPLLPFVLAGVAVEVAWETPAAAIWMIARVVTVAAMWRWTLWRGRWSVLWAGLAAMGGGFALIMLGGSITAVLIALAIFGVGMGLIYYAALYYAMSVGRAAVDASGTHEALIGCGYAAGPLAALGAASVGPESPWPLIATTWAMLGAGGLGMLLAWQRGPGTASKPFSGTPKDR